MGRKKSQTVGYRYKVGVHFTLCHGPIDNIRAIYVDEKPAWEPIAYSAAGIPDGYETIHINKPELFGGEDREGGIVGDIDIGMGYKTQPKNSYLQSVLENKLVPAYRGAVSVILKHLYVGTNPYLKPWKFRAQRIWAPTATDRAQWHPSTAGIGPPPETLPATEAGIAVLHDKKLYRIPAAVVGPGDSSYGHARINKVTETDLITGEQRTYGYSLTVPEGVTNPSVDMLSKLTDRPQQDATLVYTGPTGPEIFCGFYTASIVGGVYALILELTARTHRWVRIPDEWFAVPLYTPGDSASKLRYGTICWVVRASDDRIYFKSIAGWNKSRYGTEDWQQDTVAFRVASFDPASGGFRREAWADGANVSPPLRGTGIIGAAMNPGRTSLVEHCQFMIAINNVISFYNGLMRYDFGTQQREMIGGPSLVQAWLFNRADLAGNPVLLQLGITAWGSDDTVYTMMPKLAGQLQSGMLAVWLKTSNPAGTETVWKLHWPDQSDYIADDESFWFAPSTNINYLVDWYSTPISLADGRVVFPPASPYKSGAMVCPAMDGSATGTILTKWSGATLGAKPWMSSASLWGGRLSGPYMVGVQTDDNDYILVSGSYGRSELDYYGGTWQGDGAEDDPDCVRFLVSYDDGSYTRLLTGLSNGPWDMNPAHIIRECMTNTEWGRGLPESIIGPTFTEAANTLYKEGLGLSMLWTSEMAVNDFILEVIRHIDAVRYEDPETGLQEIKLIRPDYDVATLPVLTPSNCSLEQLTEPMLYDLVNQITINYWNRESGSDAALAVQDTAAINMVGTINNQTMEYSGICSDRVALMIGQRDLARYSKPFRQGRLTVNRRVANLKVGDVFLLTWPARGVDRLVCRVARRSDNGELDGMTGIEFGEDIFGEEYRVATVPPPSGWVDPISPPSNFDQVTGFDEPYPMLVERLGEEAAVATRNDSSYFVFAGGRPGTGSHIDYGFFAYPEGTPPVTDSLQEWDAEFTPTALLGEDITEITDAEITVAVTSARDMSNVRAGDWVLVGDAADRQREVMTIAEDPGSSPVSLKLVRAVADTYPKAAAVGTSLYIVGTFAGTDTTERTDGEQVEAYGRPKNGKGAYQGPFTYLDVEMLGRQGRPYPAAAFKVDGSYQPALGTPADAVTLTWAHRHRVQQSNQPVSWLAESNFGPETGVSYHLRRLPLDAALAPMPEMPVIDVGTGTSYELDLVASPMPEGAVFADLIIEARRGALVSLQNRKIRIAVSQPEPVLLAPFNLTANYSDALAAPTGLTANYSDALLAPTGLTAQYSDALLAPTRLTAQYSDALLAPTRLTAQYSDALLAPFSLTAQYVEVLPPAPTGLHVVSYTK